MDEQVAKLLVRFGWFYGMDVTVVKRFIELYDEMGVFGKVFSLGVVDVVLLENGWIEQVNVSAKGKPVYRCVGIGELLVKFKVSLDSFYEQSNQLLGEIKEKYNNEGDKRFMAKSRMDVLNEVRKGKSD